MKKQSGKTGPKAVLLVMGLLLMTVVMSSAYAETLRILDWGGYVPDEHIQAFTKLVKAQYGVDLTIEVTSIGSPDEIFEALRAGTADIVLPAQYVAKDERFQLIKRKLVLPLNLENIPNYQHVIPTLQNAEYCTENGEVYAVPIALGLYGLAYNTAKFREEPKSWNILWDPRFKQRYAVGDIYEYNTYITALALGRTPDEFRDVQNMITPELQEKLTALAVNANRVWQAYDKPEDLQGLDLAAAWGTAFPGLKEQGEIWKFANPEEGTWAFIDNYMISHTLRDKPELRRIADAWLNYALSDEYQVFVRRSQGLATVTSSVLTRLTPEEIALYHLDEPTYFEKNYIIQEALQQRIRKTLKQIWTQAMKQRE